MDGDMRRAERPWKKHDVIQIGATEQFKPPFWAKLAIIEEVKPWGVIVRIETFEGDAYLRIPWHHEFHYVGELYYVRADNMEVDEEAGNGSHS